MSASTPPQVQQQTATAERPLYAVLAAAILVPVILLVWSAWNSYHRHFNEAKSRLSGTVEIASDHATHVFDTHRLVIEQIDQLLDGLSDEQIRKDEKRLHARLRFLALSHGPISSVYVFDSACRAVASSAAYPLSPDVTCDNREYARVHREGLLPADASYVGLIRGRVSDQTVIIISRRRKGEQGDFNGITSVSIDAEYFPTFFSRMAHMGFTTAVLAREDGTFLARYPHIAAAVPKLPSDSVMMETIRKAPDRGTFRSFSPVDGLWRHIAYRRLEGYPVYLTVGLDDSVILAAWRAEVMRNLFFALPAAGALVLLTLFAIGRTRREATALQSLHEETSRRQAAEEQLRHRQKLEAIGQLTGGIAHDFNNLLMVVDGAISRIRKNPTGEKAIRSLDMVKIAVERGTSLTRQLLSFSQRRTIQPSVIDVGDLLKQSKDLLVRALRGDVEIRFELDEEACLALVDRAELDLAIINLAVNARDAMPEGGSFTVSVRPVRLSGEPEAGGLRGEFISIALTDTGSGIDPEHMPRIFEPYFTTKQSDRGTGLGLSQVYGFAKQAGGHVSVASALGRGTTFIIYLPRAAGTPATKPSEEPAAPVYNLRSRSVLLVEDNDQVAEMVTGMLEELGHTVERVTGVAEALVRLRSKPDFDHVVTDILMPGGKGGTELARSIRNSNPSLPVLLMTGYSDKAQAAVEDGFMVLKKPFTLPDLDAALRETSYQDKARVA